MNNTSEATSIISINSLDINKNKNKFGKFIPDKNKCDAGKYKIPTVSDARNLFGKRDIYIWGAGQKGRGFYLALKRNGFNIKSFIDVSPEMKNHGFMGNVVITPDEFFSDEMIADKSFVLTASVDSKNIEMAEILISKGFTKGISFENIQTLSPFYPTIEVTGICNLRCSSCIRSDKSIIEDGKFMSFNDYSRVINKMVTEIPFLYLVDLYVFGEPILNNELPKIIKLNNELGLASGLSTNLYNIKNLAKVLDEYPAQIRVSLSGASEETYDVTHTGGKWKRVAKNLDLLGELIHERGSKTIVEVYFHIYKHNLHEIKIIKEICNKYGFRFHPSLAVLFSDFAMQYSQSGAVSDGAKVANDLTIISLEELLKDCQDSEDKNCILTRIVPVINWDLSVMACCNYTYSPILPNYLDVPIEEIVKERTNSELCAKCQSHALHRWNHQVHYSKFVKKLVDENA